MKFSRINSIQLKADELRKEVGLSISERADLDIIASYLNIEVFYKSLTQNILGACKTHGIRRVILLNDNIDYEKRLRFTYAHEIGHLYLNHGDQFCNVKSFFSADIEKEANQFASELLMPHKYVKHISRKQNINCALITSLAKQFDLSYSSVAISVLKEFSDSCVLVYNENGVFNIFNTDYFFNDKPDDEITKLLCHKKDEKFELKNHEIWFNSERYNSCQVETKFLNDGSYLSVFTFI